MTTPKKDISLVLTAAKLFPVLHAACAELSTLLTAARMDTIDQVPDFDERAFVAIAAFRKVDAQMQAARHLSDAIEATEAAE